MDSTESGVIETEPPADFARRLGLKFKNGLLLSRALTHRSYLNEHPEALEDNERLEFLGDAVLDFLVGAWLYNRFPEMREGELTRLRSALVRTEQLAEFAGQHGFGAAMRLGRGESQAGGRARQALLCATFEAWSALCTSMRGWKRCSASSSRCSSRLPSRSWPRTGIWTPKAGCRSWCRRKACLPRNTAPWPPPVPSTARPSRSKCWSMDRFMGKVRAPANSGCPTGG